MRLRPATALAVLLAAPAAHAQVSNHAIAVESGVSAPLAVGGGGGATFAVSASTWIAGDVEGFARGAWTSAGRTAGRGADAATVGTLGLRLSLGPAPLRVQLLADVGWARVDASPVPEDRLAYGLGAGIELFAATDLSIGARALLRGAGGDLRLEPALAVAVYF